MTRKCYAHRMAHEIVTIPECDDSISAKDPRRHLCEACCNMTVDPKGGQGEITDGYKGDARDRQLAREAAILEIRQFGSPVPPLRTSDLDYVRQTWAQYNYEVQRRKAAL